MDFHHPYLWLLPQRDPTDHPYGTVVDLCVVPCSTAATQWLSEGEQAGADRSDVRAAVRPVEGL